MRNWVGVDFERLCNVPDLGLYDIYQGRESLNWVKYELEMCGVPWQDMTAATGFLVRLYQDTGAGRCIRDCWMFTADFSLSVECRLMLRTGHVAA